MIYIDPRPLNIELGETPQVRIQLLRPGVFKHPAKKLVFDEATLSELERNFNAGIVGRELPVNVDHAKGSESTVGWIKRVERDSGGLYGVVEITNPAIAEKVRRGDLKYASAELDFNREDPASGKAFNVIKGAAFTNFPYLKGMQPAQAINLSEITREEALMPKELELASQVELMEAKLQEKETALIELSEKMQKLELAQTALLAQNAQQKHERILDRYRDHLPPAVQSLFSHGLAIARGESVSLADLFTIGGEPQHEAASAVSVNLSEEGENAATIETVLLSLLNEYPAEIALGEAKAAPTPFLNTGERGQTALIQRADKIASERGIPYHEAVKLAASSL